MTDIPSRLADLRCPRCDAVQPLYASGGGGAGLQRGAEVVACPGCGVGLRLEQGGDPGGVVAAVVMVVLLTGAILGTVIGGARGGLGTGATLALVAGLVVAGVVLAVLWNARAAGARRLVMAQEAER